MLESDQKRYPLYDPAFEHDACGIGAVVDLNSEPSHQRFGLHPGPGGRALLRQKLRGHRRGQGKSRPGGY